MMEHIKKKVLRGIVTRLAAVGAKFAILLPDGELIDGGLKTASMDRLKPKGKGRRDWSQFGMSEKVAAMKPGSVIELDTKGTPFSPSALLSNLCSRGIYHYGKGNFVTSIKGTRVQALRVK